MPTTAARARDTLQVALALVLRDGRVLVKPRAQTLPQGGMWEWPGGKCRAGESITAAAARELHEETGLQAQQLYPLISVPWCYEELSVELHACVVTACSGVPRQPARWVEPAQLVHYPMPMANRGILQALLLPSLYAITPATLPPAVLEPYLAAGLRMVYLRGMPLSAATPLAELCLDYGAVPMLDAGLAAQATQLNAGVQLHHRALLATTTRPQARCVGASCHNIRELEQAARLGADFATLSPVLPASSHPQDGGMGWEVFRRQLATAPIPVYALGGMRVESMRRAWACGAHGIALLSHLWKNPPAVVQQVQAVTRETCR